MRELNLHLLPCSKDIRGYTVRFNYIRACVRRGLGARIHICTMYESDRDYQRARLRSNFCMRIHSNARGTGYFSLRKVRP